MPPNGPSGPLRGAMNFLLLLVLPLVQGFSLEGSEYSFVRYPKWYHAFENVLSFEFKTTALDGLIFYTDDKGHTGNFYEMSVKQGVLEVKFKIGRHKSDTVHLVVEGQMVNDGVWHKVTLFQFWEKIKLEVDQWVKFKELKQKDYVFGQYDTNLDVYIGGLPQDLPDNTLSSPLSKRMLHFGGSIRNVIYRTLSHGVTSPHVISSKGMRQTGDDYCSQRKQPLCENDGVCYSSNDGAKCNCAHTDYEGPRCEIEKPADQASFYGSEFLSYDFSEHDNGVISNEENVTLYFKTRRPDGLIFYAGDQEDYIHLCLDRGLVVATSSLGGATRQVRVSPFNTGISSPGLRFNDNKWHRVILHRRLNMITLSVDSVYSDVKQSAGSREFLTNVFAYVGGVPKMRIPDVLESRKFVGCLTKIRYRADSKYIDFLELAKEGSQSIIQISGNVLFSCRDLIAPEPVSFLTSETYVKLPYWEAPSAGSISFQMRTNEADGLVLFNSGPIINATADYFAFELLDGLLYFIINLGSGPVRLQTGSTRLDDLKWHSVTLIRTARSGSVQVDKLKTDFNTPGTASQLDLGGKLFLGGFSWTDTIQPTPAEVYTLSLRKGYIGCLKDLNLNGMVSEIIDYMTQRSSAQMEVGCIDNLAQCPSAPCQYGAKCEEGWNRFKCDCSNTFKTGATCEDDPMRMNFEKAEQMLRVTLPHSAKSKAEDVQVKFRTNQGTAVLVATSCAHTFDRLEILLHNGALELHMNFGSKKTQQSYKWGKRLDDEKWHTAKIERRGLDVRLFLDGVLKKKEHLKAENFLLEYDSFWAGKSKNPNPTIISQISKSAENSISLGGFLGDLADYIFNGIDVFRLAAKQHNGEQAILGPKTNVTAKFGAHRSIRENIVTFTSRSAYAVLPDALISSLPLLHIFFQFRTLEPSGLLMYSRGLSRDFFAVELENGRLKYTFNTGDGAESLYSKTNLQLTDFNWHMVLITQQSSVKHVLAVDDSVTKFEVQGTNKQLNLRGPLYVGGVGQPEYRLLVEAIAARHGFRGCLASLEVSQTRVNLLSDNSELNDVQSGCHGPSILCQEGSCANGGVCLQKWSNISCDCSLTTFTGPKCTESSTSFEFGPSPSMIVYKFPMGHEPSTENDSLALGFKTTTATAVIFRVDCSVAGDYLSIELLDGYVRASYNLGTQDHVVGDIHHTTNDNRYHTVKFHRDGANATFQLDEYKVYSRSPIGQQLKTLNKQSTIQIGARVADTEDEEKRRWKRSDEVEMRQPFQGVISGINFNNMRLLDLAAQGDERIQIIGDPPPNLMPGAAMEPLNPEQWPSDESNPQQQGQPDDLITGREEGSGCHEGIEDDEDCTILPDNPTDLITPVLVLEPTTTTTEAMTTLVIDEVEGSGDPEGGDPDPDPRAPKRTTPRRATTSAPGTGDPHWTSLKNQEQSPKTPETSTSTTTTTTEPSTSTSTSTTTSTPPTTTKRTPIPTRAPPPNTTPRSTFRAVRPTTPFGDQQPTTTEPLVKPKTGETGFPRTSLILGVSLGLIIAIILVVFIVFKCYNRTKQADSYLVDSASSSKAYAPLSSGQVAPGAEDPILTARVTQVNGYTKGAKRKGFKEWYV